MVSSSTSFVALGGGLGGAADAVGANLICVKPMRRRFSALALALAVLLSGCAGVTPISSVPSLSPGAGTEDLPPLRVLSAPVTIPSTAVIDPLAAVQVPQNITPAPGGSNVKLWITDPREPGKALDGSGLFYWLANETPAFVPANSDGSFYATWKPGTYTIDIVEPSNNTADYVRRAYTVRVTKSGSTVDGVVANANGISVVGPGEIERVPADIAARVDELTALANVPVSAFSPSSPCQLVDQVTPARGLGVELSAGFPKVPLRLPSVGTIRALIIPVSFTDLTSERVPAELFKTTAEGVRDFYFAQSYGALAFDFSITPNWVEMPVSVQRYGSSQPDGWGWKVDNLLGDVLRLTADQITYGDYDVVYVLPPETVARTQFGNGPALPGIRRTTSGVFTSASAGGWDMFYNNDGVSGGDWKWMAHETGHLFGLYDEDLEHKSQSLGEWGIMAASWSNYAIELGAWDRYLQGWLKEPQIACRQLASLSAAGETITVDPLVGVSTGLKSIMIPLSSSKMLVIESRKPMGFDAPLSSGILVYTVDMKVGQLGGGYVVVPRIGFTDTEYFRDAPLRAGDSVTVGGVTIAVLSIGEGGDVVKISR
jgi:M6 family metalloprotease-like protein